MKKIFVFGAACLCMLSASAQHKKSQKAMTDSIYSIQNVDVVDYRKEASQQKPVSLMGMDVKLKDLPLSVSRLDSKTLERKHIFQLEDAVKFLPGVVQSSDQLGAFKRYSVRGTTDAVIAYDGIRDERSLLNNVPFGDLSYIESIEVVKGPSSVLSGHSVMGGVINIIRKKATAEQNAHASISLGSWNQKEATVGFGGRLAGPVNYRANVHYANGDGFRDVNVNNFSGLFAIGSEITKNGYLDANFTYSDDRYTTDIGGAPTMPGDVYSVNSGSLFAASGTRNPLFDYKKSLNDNANNKMKRLNMDFTLNYRHKLTDFMNIRENFAWGHSNLDYVAVENTKYRTSVNPIYNYFYTNAKGVKTYIDIDSVQSGAPLCFNPDSWNLTNTFELNGKFYTGSVRHNYNLGWNYSYFDYTQYNGYGADDVWGPGMGEMVSVADPHTVRDWWDSKVSAASIRNYITNGVYLHDMLEINKYWKALVGLRYDNYHYQTATATIADGKQHYEEANRTAWNENRTNALTYKVGVVYQPLIDLSVYASASSYFKPNTTVYNKNYLYFDSNWKEFNPDADGGQVFKPETGNQFELGARYEIAKWFDVNASVFYIRKFNVVRTIGNLGVEEAGAVVNKSVRAQIGRQETKGFDLDFTVRPLPTMQIVGGLAYSDMRTIASNFSGMPDNIAEIMTYNEDGTINLRATNFPRTTFFTYVDYTIPRGALKDLSFHFSGQFTDKMYTSIANNVYFPSRYLVDLGVFYTIKKHITLAVNINNLFNHEYFISTTRLGKPRNFMCTIAYNFK